MSETIPISKTMLRNTGNITRNGSVATLVTEALLRGEGHLAENGALVVSTGARTGRSPNDKFFVRRLPSSEKIWWGKVNQACEEGTFERVLGQILAYLQKRDLYIFDGFVGADPAHRLAVRVVTPLAWQALFAHTLFRRPSAEELAAFTPDFTILDAGELKLDPKDGGLASEAFVGCDLENKLVAIAGTGYAGEIKKSLFTIMNYALPQKGVMTMHCSANVGADGDVALFFGLSGTGKTTLSADPARRLIGDDEHGWTDRGVFNFEGGCYAKCINLSEKAEPQIFRAIRFGSVLENVIIDRTTGKIDYDDSSITENTRATYPVEYIPGCVLEGTSGHPRDIFFLTCDASGILPPIARLDIPHAMYHFLSGYTAKLAGTVVGVKEPTATFSACFGEPFMPLHPARYADLLGEKIKKHGSRVWLVNTGWSGGPYGVGQRMSIKVTRRLLSAALNGELDKVAYRIDPIFGFEVPTSAPEIEARILDPQSTWADPAAYVKAAEKLAAQFIENFKAYESGASAEIRAAAPLRAGQSSPR